MKSYECFCTWWTGGVLCGRVERALVRQKKVQVKEMATKKKSKTITSGNIYEIVDLDD